MAIEIVTYFIAKGREKFKKYINQLLHIVKVNVLRVLVENAIGLVNLIDRKPLNFAKEKLFE